MAGFPAHTLNLLAFDTSTETLSVALACGGSAGARVLAHEGAGGAQSSATLVPAVQALLAEGGIALAQLDAIVFGRGPGSFTGLRTACSVAQGLAFGAGVPVLGVETLLAVAEQARLAHGVTRVVALLDARMGEVYWAVYAFEGNAWRTLQPPALGRPEQVPRPDGFALAGNAMEALPALPTARALLSVAPALLAAGHATSADGALPLYIRDKVAQTTEERAAAKRAGAPRP